MKRVSLLLRFVLAVPIVCLLSAGLIAESNDKPASGTAAAKQTTSKKAKTPAGRTSSGSTKATPVVDTPAPAPPNPADELKSYPRIGIQHLEPVQRAHHHCRRLQ